MRSLGAAVSGVTGAAAGGVGGGSPVSSPLPQPDPSSGGPQPSPLNGMAHGLGLLLLFGVLPAALLANKQLRQMVMLGLFGCRSQAFLGLLERPG